MKHIRNLSLYILISLTINGLSLWLDSSFLKDFLNENIIILLITLLGINIAINGLLIPKLTEFGHKYDVDFDKTYKEIKKSFLEQILLILLAVITMIFSDSAIMLALCSNLPMITTFILSVLFIYAIAMLWDTGNAMFIMTKKTATQNSQDTP